MSESCNSRHFSWLMKSCFPNPNAAAAVVKPSFSAPTTTSSPLSLLPDDLLLECLSRVPSSSLPSVSLVCRRWLHLLHSPSFLSLRRLHRLLHPSVFAFSSSGISLASLRLHPHDVISWKLSSFLLPFDNLSNARLSSIGPRIFIIARYELLCYDTWSGLVSVKSPMLFPRKKFASAVVCNKIYVAGGGSHASLAVEEYDPRTDTWRVVSHSPRRRYGCIGASMDGIFYVIGGLKIGGALETTRAAATAVEAHVYASSMDLYDVKTGVWLRSRAVPGGGCLVAACAAAGEVYILASHAVELSFWKFHGLRHGGSFGEWHRIKSPPLPAQVRLDGRVRFSCVGLEDKVVLIQVIGSIDDLLRRSGRNSRGLKEGLVMVYDCVTGEWRRWPDLPEAIRRAACVSVEC